VNLRRRKKEEKKKGKKWKNHDAVAGTIEIFIFNTFDIIK